MKHIFKHRTVHLIIIFCLLNACASPLVINSNQKQKPLPNTPTTYQSSYICHQISSYADKIIGDGQCVSLIKKCSSAPQTSLWKPGKKVLSLPRGSIKPGSIIATFKNGKYPNKTGYHAAIYISHNVNGILVWDQWSGKAVHKRLIRTRNDNASSSNTAQAYYLVE